MIPLHLISLARIIIFMIAILAHARQVEWTARLDFLWQLQASQEKREMSVLQQSNKRILYNLLPAHVAAHFLDDQFRNNMVSKRRKNNGFLKIINAWHAGTNNGEFFVKFWDRFALLFLGYSWTGFILSKLLQSWCHFLFCAKFSRVLHRNGWLKSGCRVFATFERNYCRFWWGKWKEECF